MGSKSSKANEEAEEIRKQEEETIKQQEERRKQEETRKQEEIIKQTTIQQLIERIMQWKALEKEREVAKKREQEQEKAELMAKELVQRQRQSEEKRKMEEREIAKKVEQEQRNLEIMRREHERKIAAQVIHRKIQEQEWKRLESERLREREKAELMAKELVQRQTLQSEEKRKMEEREMAKKVEQEQRNLKIMRRREHERKVAAQNMHKKIQEQERKSLENERIRELEKGKLMAKELVQRQPLHSNAKLLETITSHVSANTESHFALEELKYSEYDFYWVQNLFRNTTRGKCLDTSKIERVHNPYILALYNLKKESMKASCGSVKEVHLFYGVTMNLLQPFLQNNIDYRNRRHHKGGLNVKFSSIAYFVNQDCDKTDGERVMLLCKVLIRNPCTGNDTLALPPVGYDTIVNKKNVYKYSDDTFYPLYKITLNS